MRTDCMNDRNRYDAPAGAAIRSSWYMGIVTFPAAHQARQAGKCDGEAVCNG